MEFDICKIEVKYAPLAPNTAHWPRPKYRFVNYSVNKSSF